MVATRGRTFKRPWRRSCLSSKLKSSSAPIGRKDSWCFHAVGSSNAPLLGSTAAEGLPRIGRTSIATRWRSCGLPQSASCCENFVIPLDVFGQTLKKAGAAPGKDGSPMLGQKSTKLPCFGHSSAGISFAFVIVVRAVSPFGRPNVGFGVHSVIAVMSLHDRSCTESGNQSAILLCRRSANCTQSSRGQSWVQTGERLRRDAFSDRSGRDQNALPGSRAAPRS